MITAFYYRADADLFTYLRRQENLRWLRRHYLQIQFESGGRLALHPRQVNGYRGMWTYRYCAARCEAFDTGRIYVNVGNMAESIVERKEELLQQVYTVMRLVHEPGFRQQPLDHGMAMPERQRDSAHHRRTEYHQLVWDRHQRECQQRLAERSNEQSG